jgi:hypothetical protein
MFPTRPAHAPESYILLQVAAWGMGLLKLLWNLIVYSLVIVGLVTVAFVVLSYGWDGEPPRVELESSED